MPPDVSIDKKLLTIAIRLIAAIEKLALTVNLMRLFGNSCSAMPRNLCLVPMDMDLVLKLNMLYIHTRHRYSR